MTTTEGEEKKEPQGVEILTAHYKQCGMKKISVPEWDGMEIYSKPLTIRDRDRIRSLSGNSPARTGAAALVVMARDEKGEAKFSEEDMETLTTESDSTIVDRVGLALMGMRFTEEEIEKK